MTPEPGPAAISAERLLLVGTGSIGVAFLPYWLSWLRMSYPDLPVRVVLTRSAERFVTPMAVSAFAGSTVTIDEWPDTPVLASPHVEMAEWPDTILVLPATLNYLARLAIGLGDTPSLLALQCTRAVIGLAAGLPPGGWQSPAMRGHRTALAARPNVVVVPPMQGRTVAGNENGEQAVPLPVLLTMVERLRTRLAAAPPTSP